MKRLSLLGAFLMLLSLAAKSDYYRFVESQVVKNGVIYYFAGDYRDGEGEENTAYAYVYGLTDDFTGTNLVIEDSVLVELTKSSGGGGFIEAPRRTGADNITVNIPVKDLYFNDYITEVTSLTLPKTITGEELIIYNRLSYLKNLEEIIVEDDNEKYSSNHGLLCNAAGDSLLYIPKKSYQIDGDCLTVPMGIHYDVTYKSWEVSYPDYFYINRIHYKDELSTWPIYSGEEMWFENNQTPPEGYPTYGSYILHIPAGCLSAYKESGIGASYIVEIGSNLDIINKNPLGTAFYDADGDGEIDIFRSSENTIVASKSDGTVIYTNSDYSGIGLADSNCQIYQNPGREDLTYATTSISWYMESGRIWHQGEIGKLVEEKGNIYVDVNGDGLKDCVKWYSLAEPTWNMSLQRPDGTFVKTVQTLIDKDEQQPTGGRLPSLRDGMFLGDTGPQTLTSINMAADVNGDGILDLMDTKYGGILYSNGDNQWLKYSTKTLIWPCDINGDGEEDLVIYDGETVSLITNRNSASPTKTELFKSKIIQNVLFKDFDKDGDIDILLTYAAGGSTNMHNYTNYFIFLRNNGNGTFRKKESNIPQDDDYILVSCGDYDNDGLYELLVYKNYTVRYGYTGKLLKVNGDFTISEHTESFAYGGTNGVFWSSPTFGDFNNDGYTEWYANQATLYGHLNSQTTRNTAPQKMAKPTAVLQPETGWLKITWQRGQDQETSACDLTYELRIGTEPGKGNILCAASLEDGRRRTLREGEIGTSLYKLFNANTLKPGKYYIAVQAIDAGGLGGAFSDEFVYEQHPTNPSFTFDIQKPSTADEVFASVKAPDPDATYEWILSEGDVLSQGVEGAKLQFHRMGEHTVSLNMTLDGTVYKGEPQTIYVDAASGKGNGGVSLYSSYKFFDINQDGYPEYIGYQNDGQGNLTKVPLSLYSESLGYVCFVADYDRDGYPDFVTNGSNKGNLFLNYGEQDFDFDNQTVDTSFPGGSYTADLNNDGRTDVVEENMKVQYSQYDAGDGLTYNNVDESNNSYYSCFYDVNRDGLLDIITVKNYLMSPYYKDYELWTVRYKDNSADMVYGEEQELFKVSKELLEIELHGGAYNCHYADVDNDGCVDLILPAGAYSNYSYERFKVDSVMYIIKGVPNGVGTETIKVEGVAYVQNSSNSSSLGIECIRDIDNDGVLDIVLAGELYNPGTSIVHMNQKGRFVAEKVNVNTHIYGGEIWMVLKDGGYPQTSNSLLESTIKNAKPSAPATVAAKQTADGLLITWADAADDHTPAVQMRYNVSVKRKGKTGPGAYIISPMNGETDVATIVSNYLYKQSTQMLIPASVLTAGETYEIRVQAIDLWNEVSRMTKSIEFTMGGGGYIDMTERVATNKEITIKYIGAQASSYNIDAGQDGTIVNTLGNGQYVLSWSTPGVKQISITAGSTTVTSSITVVNPIALDFSVPATVFAGAPLSISLNPEMAAETIGTGLRCDDKSVTIDYASGGETAMVTFSEPGSYTLEAYSEDEVRGGTYQCVVNVGEMMPEAVIQCVDVTGNNYYVQWDKASLPAAITEVIVLREGNSLNQFIVMDTVSVADGYYVDASSNALVVSNRYGIILKTVNGQTSAMSVVHKPLHVMLSNSSMGGYNLMWNSYEGLVVDNYQVWRGSTPESMGLYEQVAGSQQSYTDLNPLPGTSYYTIVFNLQHPMESMRRASANADGNVRSNYITTNNATSLVLAESIEITNGTDIVLTEVNPDIRLYCTILPVYCTVNDVAWSIVEGADIATIDSDGRLHVTGSGQVKVRATTLDGSNLSAEATITSQFSEFKPGDVNGDGDVDIADAVCIVNYVVGKPNTTFIEAAADANGDGDIDIADAVHIVNYVVGKIQALAPRFEWNLPEPE